MGGRGPAARGPGGFGRSPSHPPRPFNVPIEVVHEDDAILAVRKPPGLPTALPPGHDGASLLDSLRRARKRGTLKVVHEVDRDATGIVVFARTPEAYTALKESLKKRDWHRGYIAAVECTPDAPVLEVGAAGTIESYLVPGPRGTFRAVDDALPRDMQGPRGRTKRAVTHYRVEQIADQGAILRVRPEGDHAHQIRVHLADAGMPLLGDATYGTEHKAGQVALHLGEIGLPHPYTCDTILLRSPPPAGFWKQLGLEPPEHAREPAPQPERAPQPEHTADTDQGWDHVAGWYDELVERRSDHHERVITPGVARLLALEPGERMLDVACGQGAMLRALAEKVQTETDRSIEALGVDAAPELIERAAERAPGSVRFVTGDARELAAVEGITPGAFHAASCVMAAMNIDPIEPVFQGIAEALAPGGRFVLVTLHPAFRVPKSSAWGWTDAGDDTVQFRRVDRYLSEHTIPIVMNPGAASDGAETVETTTHHRPMSAYIAALVAAGLLVDAMEEWSSDRISEPGPRAEAENTARREIPMFLALRAIKPSRS